MTGMTRTVTGTTPRSAAGTTATTLIRTDFRQGGRLARIPLLKMLPCLLLCLGPSLAEAMQRGEVQAVAEIITTQLPSALLEQRGAPPIDWRLP